MIADLFVNVVHEDVCHVKTAMQVGQPILAAIEFGVEVVGDKREHKAFEVREDACKVEEVFIAFICVFHVKEWKNNFQHSLAVLNV
jgi:hypothetical protein